RRAWRRSARGSGAAEPRSGPTGRPRCSSTGGTGRSGHAISARLWKDIRGASCPGAWSRRTRFGIRSPPICWKGEPTSGRYRSSSVMRRSPRRSATPTCRGPGSSRRTGAPIRGRDVATTKKASTKVATKAAPKRGKTKRAAATAPGPSTITIPPHVDDELAAVWHAFKGGADVDARERLILHYAPLGKCVASRVATGLPASVEQADLVSYGMFGLIDALEKFEPARGNKFETYAIPRIKRAIIDELRARDLVPR